MSSKPVLYYMPYSAPSRAVLLVAAALDIDLDLITLNLFAGENKTPEFLEINPQHTIPLLNDNGVYIADSHAIASYLCGKYGEDDSLYPKDLVKRAIVDSRLHFDTGHLSSRMRFLFEPIWMLGATELPEERINYVRISLDIMERFLAKSPYLCGDKMTIADLCCIATISSFIQIFPLDTTEHAKLIEWTQRMTELPYYKEKNAGGAEGLKNAILKMMQDNLAKES